MEEDEALNWVHSSQLDPSSGVFSTVIALKGRKGKERSVMMMPLLEGNGDMLLVEGPKNLLPGSGNR